MRPRRNAKHYRKEHRTMNQFRFNILAATVIAGAGMAFLTLPAAAQSVTKRCSTQYNAAKEAGTLNGQKWPQFLSECSARLKEDKPDTDAAAPAAKTPVKKQAKETTTKAKKTETAAAAPASGMSACQGSHQGMQHAVSGSQGSRYPQWPEMATVPLGLQRQPEVRQLGRNGA